MSGLNISFYAAEEAREYVLAGLDYLANVDGYSRDDLQNLADDAIADLYEED